MDVETTLKRIEDLAAVVRAFADNSATANEGVTPEALSGAGDVCRLISELAQVTRKALHSDALNTQVKPVTFY